MKKLIIPALAIMALLLPSWAMAQSPGGAQRQETIIRPTADHGKNYQANQKAQKGPEAVKSQPKPVTKPGHQKTKPWHQKTTPGHQKPDLSGKSPIYPGEPGKPATYSGKPPIYPGEPGKPATYSGKPPIYPGEPGKPPIYPDNPKSPGANAAHRGKN